MSRKENKFDNQFKGPFKVIDVALDENSVLVDKVHSKEWISIRKVKPERGGNMS